MENHPFLWRRIRRVRRIQVCMARKGLNIVRSATLKILLFKLSSFNIWLGEFFFRPMPWKWQFSADPVFAGQQGALSEKLLQAGEDDVLLWDISKEFFDYESVLALAILLLDGVGRGGYAFLQSHFQPGVAVPKNVLLAHNVLREWLDEKPRETRRGKLFEVLLEANPLAADAFRAKLLGWRSTHVWLSPTVLCFSAFFFVFTFWIFFEFCKFNLWIAFYACYAVFVYIILSSILSEK